MASGALLVLVLLGGLALVAVVAVVNYQMAKQRREAFDALAARHGWVYAARDDSWTSRFVDAPFGQGFNRQALNVLTGTYDGRPFVAFDYRYSTRQTTRVNGQTRTRTVVHPYSVVAVGTGASFPPLRVTPEGMVGRLIGRITDSDIELESEDFNRMFTVSSPNRKFASDVLHPRMMQLLMRWPDLGWQLQGAHLIVFHGGSHSEAEVEAKLPVVDAIVDGIPDFVWRAVLGQVPPAQPRHDPAPPPDPV